MSLSVLEHLHSCTVQETSVQTIWVQLLTLTIKPFHDIAAMGDKVRNG